ncbi:hypothetical protein [Marinicella sp. W31]|uniref:hypothetical protein n=1 Tax=Marinicella sp. W31 TaxID=3023713 RepID=UPI0037572858
MHTLKEALQSWDGKQTDFIGQIYTDLSQHSDFIEDCIALLQDPKLQSGASWLLKQHHDSGKRLDEQHITAVFNALEHLEHWQAKLHILQSMAYMRVAKKQLNHVRQFIQLAINDDNKFVRAWGYDGLYQLARQYPQYSDETREFFSMAMRDEAASVKARIRNILKQWN